MKENGLQQVSAQPPFQIHFKETQARNCSPWFCLNWLTSRSTHWVHCWSQEPRDVLPPDCVRQPQSTDFKPTFRPFWLEVEQLEAHHVTLSKMETNQEVENASEV
ncbi:hypothetical protein LEMLEM_LOCUS7118 [Lemmus lemmus]